MLARASLTRRTLTSRRVLLRTGVLVAAGVGACAEDPVVPVVCSSVGIPSIVAEVRNQRGVPAAIGAELRAIGNGVELAGSGFGDSLRIYTEDPYGVGGVFSVEVSKPWHRSARLEGLEVPAGACGVAEPYRVELVIELQENAPPVRQVALPPTGYGFGDGNLSMGIPAFVEADEGVSRELRWGSSDSTVVAVSQTGRITSGCLERTDSAWVTAWSVVDTTVRDSIFVTVWPLDPGSGRCR